MQAEMVHRLTEQVCNRINLSLAQHLPSVAMFMTEFEHLQKQFVDFEPVAKKFRSKC